MKRSGGNKTMSQFINEHWYNKKYKRIINILGYITLPLVCLFIVNLFYIHDNGITMLLFGLLMCSASITITLYHVDRHEYKNNSTISPLEKRQLEYLVTSFEKWKQQNCPDLSIKQALKIYNGIPISELIKNVK